MRISVIGCGYLGAVHAAAMASLGHEVVGVDVAADRVAALTDGRAPFYEPGLDELLARASSAERLSFTTDVADAKGAAVHFVCVGTPQRADSDAADLRHVEAAFEALLPVLQPGDVVAGKSTVPVGTAERHRRDVEAAGAHLVWNPEFLREGFAIHDTLHPDRLVYGLAPGDTTSAAVLDEVYASQLDARTPRIVTDLATAELVKVAANSFLATKISFINAMAELCEVAGGDVGTLADAIGLDPRIGRRFLGAGVGFGGGCLPKDIRAFSARAHELGADSAGGLLREVDGINLRRREHVADLVREEVGELVGARVSVLGAAFKPDSDDVRDSPALDVALRLAAAGADVVVTDPRAIESARRVAPGLTYVPDLDDAVRGARAVVLLTEWREYRDADPARLGALVSRRVVVDGRRVLDRAAWEAAGWRLRVIGSADRT
ncbi:UDP-glucose dehydrogenase family protein [Luteimicrobium sp. NPDC057192]|uniref:UDP-glucose dehydrogenase family protein n=1 Tax=Luteimicrobium sp. NPDC057192 TaxID=3346042 RepID=UPI003636912B